VVSRMRVHLKQKRHIGDHNQLTEPSGKLVKFST
jgi:hypothetical protein